MCNQLTLYFADTHLFNASQYGFRKNHSTEFAALELTDLILENMNNGKIPIAIFLDLLKAFDTINHQILRTKLSLWDIWNSIKIDT